MQSAVEGAREVVSRGLESVSEGKAGSGREDGVVEGEEA